MKALKATYDGSKFLLEEPANSQAIIIVLNPEEEWYQLAKDNLNRAYGDDEPEYDLSQ